MKLAFSTLGCPDWSWKDIYATAKDLKFDGIEVRGLQNELYMPNAYPFREEHINDTLKDLKNSRLAISMLTTGISMGYDEYNDADTAKRYIDLAKTLSTPFIRVMISDKPYPEEVDLQAAANRYNEICEYASDKGVVPLIETNGVLADSAKLKQFIETVASDNKGVLWDIHHPYRFAGESPAITYANLKDYVRYIHVKDSVLDGDKVVYRMMGYGDVPIFDALQLLADNGYDGFVSLEWVKRWCPELEGAGIVFAHYISYMTYLLQTIK